MAELKEVEEGDGIVHAAAVIVQCLGCGSMLEHNLVNETPDQADELVEDTVGCPKCSEQAGRPVGIPVAVLAGAQLQALPVEGEEEAGDEPGASS